MGIPKTAKRAVDSSRGSSSAGDSVLDWSTTGGSVLVDEAFAVASPDDRAACVPVSAASFCSSTSPLLRTEGLSLLDAEPIALASCEYKTRKLSSISLLAPRALPIRLPNTVTRCILLAQWVQWQNEFVLVKIEEFQASLPNKKWSSRRLPAVKTLDLSISYRLVLVLYWSWSCARDEILIHSFDTTAIRFFSAAAPSVVG